MALRDGIPSPLRELSAWAMFLWWFLGPGTLYTACLRGRSGSQRMPMAIFLNMLGFMIVLGFLIAQLLSTLPDR
jgi:hypothetical protein